MDKKIEVLIVDDSAVVRETLSGVISSDSRFNVMGTARDPIIAMEKMKSRVPDVITLDIEMPRMDGLTFLQKIMSNHPIPVVICSSLTETNSETALRALEYGAVEIITKPKLATRRFLEESKILICDILEAAFLSRRKIKAGPSFSRNVPPKYSADVVLPAVTGVKSMIRTTEKVVVVGASTGGTEALKTFLEVLPMDAPGMVIVQHMPEHFTSAFSKRLDGLCKVTVKEAEDNDTIIRGRVLIAPGNYHTLLKRSGARYYVEVKKGPLVSRHRPSVDVLFRSASRYAGRNAVSIIMTGMGNDGAAGMKEMKEAGAVTFAQNEESCVVFGMPKEAIKLAAVDHVLPLNRLAMATLDICKG